MTSYLSNMDDHLLINWLTEYHTRQDRGPIETNTEQKPSSLRTGWQIRLIRRLKHFSNVQHLCEFLKCGHGVGITPKGWPLLFFLLTKGNNFLKLPWDRKTMGSSSPQLLAKKSSSPLPLKKNIIVTTAFWQKAQVEDAGIVLDVSHQISRAGNVLWTKAADGGWQSVTGCFNVNNPHLD